MTRSQQTQKKSSREKAKEKEPTPKGIETSKVTKKKLPFNGMRGKRRPAAVLQGIKKRVIMDAQEKEVTIPRMSIQRIVKSCCRNWAPDAKLKIQHKAIEMIRHHAEFLVNKALNDSKKLMHAQTKKKDPEAMGEFKYGVMVCDRHVAHVLTTDKFYSKATTIAYAVY